MSESSTYLNPGTVLHGPERDYTIIKVLGQGGFGVTYLVEGDVKIGNIKKRINFAVKELFISALCERNNISQAVEVFGPTAGEVNNAKQAFIKEGLRLQRMGDSCPNIVRVNEVFEANNTAYYVMEFLDGETLGDYVKRVEALSIEETQFFIEPIMKAVANLHANRMAHYDIKPQNIILAKGENGFGVVPTLIDFGLATHYDGQGQATSTIASAGYTPGYAPVEQYGKLTTFSPQSDVYALATTILYCLTGETPVEAFRLRVSDVMQQVASKLPQKVAQALARALSMNVEDRQKDAEMLLDEMFGTAVVPVSITSAGSTTPMKPVDPGKTQMQNVEQNSYSTVADPVKPKKWKMILIPAIVGVIAFLLAFVLLRSGGSTTDVIGTDTVVAVAEAVDTAVVESAVAEVAVVTEETPAVETTQNQVAPQRDKEPYIETQHQNSAARAELRREIRAADAMCPMDLGEMIGSVMSIEYDESTNTVKMNYKFTESVLKISLLKRNRNLAKKVLKLSMSEKSYRPLLEQINDAGASLSAVYKGAQSGDQVAVTLSPRDISDILNNPMTARETNQLTLDAQIELQNSMCPMMVDEITELRSVRDSGNYVVYNYRLIESDEIDLTMMRAIESQLKETLRASLSGPVNAANLKIYTNLNKGVKYVYKGSLTDETLTITFSVSELKTLM